ncbi:MAG: transcription antitermination factor NusB [Candidatus Bipolaricaulia bacterium]
MQRREAREFVLSALYQREFTGAELAELLEDAAPGGQADYIQSTFQGILDRRDEIDAMIGARTVGWRFERLALIDRNILRIGVFELLFCEDVPAEVAMDEAVELSKKFGTEKARLFVNGILDRIWQDEKTRDKA